MASKNKNICSFIYVCGNCCKIIAQRESILPGQDSPLIGPFYPQRKLFEVDIALSDGRYLTILNTHLEALDDGNVREQQLQFVYNRIKALEKQKQPFILAGDFNLLPPGFYPYLPDNQKLKNPEHINMTTFYSHKGLDVVPSLDKLTKTNHRN